MCRPSRPCCCCDLLLPPRNTGSRVWYPRTFCRRRCCVGTAPRCGVSCWRWRKERKSPGRGSRLCSLRCWKSLWLILWWMKLLRLSSWRETIRLMMTLLSSCCSPLSVWIGLPVSSAPSFRFLVEDAEPEICCCVLLFEDAGTICKSYIFSEANIRSSQTGRWFITSCRTTYKLLLT